MIQHFTDLPSNGHQTCLLTPDVSQVERPGGRLDQLLGFALQVRGHSHVARVVKSGVLLTQYGLPRPVLLT